MKQEKRSLDARQVTLIVLGFGIGGGILTLPSLAAEVFGASGWLIVLVLGLFHIGGAWIAGRLAEKFPEETIIEYSPRLLGKYLGLLFNLIYITGFLLVIPIEIRILQELVNISLLPDVPIWFVSGSFLLTIAYGASRKIDQIAQVNELLIEIAVLVGLFVVFLAMQHFKPLHLLPLFSKDQIHLDKVDILVGMAFSFASFPVISMVVPYLRNPRQTTLAVVKGNIIITLNYTVFTLIVLGVFGYQETTKLSWVALELAKSVNFEAVILERLDLVVLVSWISALYTTALLSGFVVSSGVKMMFKLKNHAYVIWALVPLVYYLSAIFTNYFVWTRWSAYVAGIFVVISVFFYPLLYLLSLRKGKNHA